VPDHLPTIMIPEQGAWIREHRGALMWGTGDGYAAVYDLPRIRRWAAPVLPRTRDVIDHRRPSLVPTLVPGS
jgi:hypothetical protein